MNHLARFTLLLSFVLCCSLHCFAQTGGSSVIPFPECDASQWKVFSSPEGRFNVLLPGTPTIGIQSYDSPTEKSNVHIFSLKTFAHYGVAYYDYPYSLEDSHRVKRLIDTARDSSIKIVNGQLLEEKDISLDGYLGRFYKASAADGYIGRVKVYVVGNRLYQLSVTMWNKDASDEIARLHDDIAAKFLDSFKLTASVGISAQEAGEPLGEVDKLLEEGTVAYGSNQLHIIDRKTDFKFELGELVIKRPQLQYPANAKTLRIQGEVAVKVMVDEEGKVMAVQIERGHPLLRAAAIRAARETELRPLSAEGKPLKYVGIIIYNFTLK